MRTLEVSMAVLNSYTFAQLYFRNSFAETYGGNCQEFMEWFGQRKQTSNLDAPLSFQEVYDISPEQCISAVLDSTFAACMYDNTQPRPM